jgi:hypothetical protein
MIGLTYPLNYVTELEIMDSFVFPKNVNFDTSVNESYFNEITMLINELYNQSYIGPKNRFHFTFNIEPLPNDNNRYLLPIPYNCIFRLAQTYNLDKSLTFNFYSPSNNAAFYDDVYQCYVYYTNPAQIEIAGPKNQKTGQILSSLYSNNDFIAFEDFTSNLQDYLSSNPSSILYSEKFYNVTLTANPYIFTIPIDLTSPLLKSDPNIPLGNPYTLAQNPELSWYGTYDDDYLSFTNSYQQIAKIGDRLIINSLQADRPPDNINNYNELIDPNGYTILDIYPIIVNQGNLNQYTYYIYKIKFNIVYNPIWYEPYSVSSVIGSFNLLNTPDPVKTTTIYVGSRRIRFTLRVETIVKNN